MLYDSKILEKAQIIKNEINGSEGWKKKGGANKMEQSDFLGE